MMCREMVMGFSWTSQLCIAHKTKLPSLSTVRVINLSTLRISRLLILKYTEAWYNVAAGTLSCYYLSIYLPSPMLSP
jgi:hypothetical protein